SPLSARIVAVSKTVAIFTAKQENIRTDKFVVINSGIDAAVLRARAARSDPTETRRALGLAPEDHAIIDVARAVPQKNYPLLLEGFALFAPKHPAYMLLIAGLGKSLENIQTYTRELGIQDRVMFLGYQKNLPAVLAVCDFFVSTSLIEGFGIAHAEALACGLPVLTTKTAGPDEMIKEGVNGFFIPEYSKEAVAASLAKMAAQDLAPMRAASPRSVERYSTERTVKAYEKLFEETAAV
ncbi:MAG: glycosyltransferase, partial [Patescibacteria group bacterium]